MAAQSSADALKAPRRVDDKPGVGDVRPGAPVVGVRVRASENDPIVIDGNNGASW
jgi:hypothetical protein